MKTTFPAWRVWSMLFLRTVLFLAAYFVVVWVGRLAGDEEAVSHARAWWPVSGVAVNAVCLGFLALAVSREGVPLWSLVGFDRRKLGSDLLRSLWMIGVSIVLAVGATGAFGWLFYGFDRPSELMSLSSLPVWALIIGIGVFPLANALVEQMTYNGYCLGRAERLVRSPGTAVTVVTLVFSLQHIAVPFAFDPVFLVWRFLSFVPLLLFWVLMYRRLRRLTPLLPTHWFMDVFALLTLVLVPMS